MKSHMATRLLAVVGAIAHNHGLMDTPCLFYMHFWANDDPTKLAQALKAALDQTNSRR